MNSKLMRIKNRENDKLEKEKALLSLKHLALPVFEQNSRAKFQKCNKCTTVVRRDYNITDEWLLEPVDVLKMKNRGFLDNIGCNIFRGMMNAMVVHPAAMKMIKHLQDEASDYTLVFAIHPDYYECKDMIQFILKSFKLGTPSENVVPSCKSIIISQDNHYESVLETYVKEGLNVFWIPVSIGFENPEFYGYSHGLVKVSFHEPYETEDFKEAAAKENFIRDHILYEIIYKAPVMTTNLVAFLMLTYFRDGGKFEEIAMKIDEFRMKSSSLEFAFEGSATDVLEYALIMLDNKISIDNEKLIRVNENMIHKLKKLAYSLMCQYLLKSSLLTAVMQLKGVDPFIDYNKMMKVAAEICDKKKRLFKVPFKPCSTIEDQLIDAFDNLVIDDLLARKTVIYTENEMRAQRIAKYFDDEDEYDDMDSFGAASSTTDELDPNNQVLINESKQDEINILMDIVLLFDKIPASKVDPEWWKKLMYGKA